MRSRSHDEEEKVPMIADVDAPGDTSLKTPESGASISRRELVSRRCSVISTSIRDNSFPTIFRILVFLLPSFVSSRLRRQLVEDRPARARPTAWLDGMRGWAAYIVFIYHTSYLFVDGSQGWGFKDTNYNWYRLPFLHVIVGGPVAISIFFVVSGFALSIKPLKQIRTGAYGDLTATLSSATIRRPIRLYGPLIISTFIVFLFGQLGIYNLTRPFVAGLRFGEHHYRPQRDGFWTDLWVWAKAVWNFCLADLYYWNSNGAGLAYDNHMWTLPIEFRGSLALFLTQLALARVRVGVRLGAVLGLIICAVQQDWWAMQLFWGGMLACELHMLYAAYHNQACSITLSETPAALGRTRWQHLRRRCMLILLHVLNATCGLYLLSMPEVGCQLTPGFAALCTLGPPTMKMKWRFWAGIGAFQLVMGAAATSVSSPLGWLSLSALFSSPLSRYMGDISYALYCVHGLVNHVLGLPLFHIVFSIIGQEDDKTSGGALVLCIALETILVVWVADVFWRAADLPMVTLSKKLEEWCLRQDT